MYFVQFPVSATNIFPLANSHVSGQLLSEHNLRSRETVATDPSVRYPIGPSYAHSMDDMKILSMADGEDIASTCIEISPGRCVVNGHYVELLTPIVIDLAAVNYKASLEGVPPLKGELVIGLVMMYSTYQTLAASALVENDDGYYEGIRVVIVPEQDMKRPIDVPEEHQYQEVNMHLHLGNFTFYNGTVTNVSQNSDKLKVFDATRVGNLSESLSDIYLSKAGLNREHLYVFSGKGKDKNNLDTWCQAEDSLMIWDTNPTLSGVKPTAQVAHFEYDNTGKGSTKLVLPHKQIDGLQIDGIDQYFPDKEFKIPNATFSLNSGGVVNPDYTKRILHIEETTNHFYRLPNGRMKKYIPELTVDPTDPTQYGTDGALPVIPVAEGTVQPIDVSTILANVSSSLVHVRSIIYSTSQEDPDGNALNLQLLGIAELLAGDEVLGNLDDAVHQISNASSVSRMCKTSMDSAIQGIEHQSYEGALRDISAAESHLAEMNSYIGRAQSQVDTAIQRLTRNPGVITELRGIVGPGSNPPEYSLNNCKNIINSALSDINSIATQIQDYIDDTVNSRLESEGVLVDTTWAPGDYVLVGSDHTQEQSVDGTYPSTMYVINYGQIETIGYFDKLEVTILESDPSRADKLNLFRHKVPYKLAGGAELEYMDTENSPPISTDLVNLNYTHYYGALKKDYFILHYVKENYERDSDDNDVLVSKTHINYFYVPTSTKIELTYLLPPIRITGGMQFATETSIGGFLNVASNVYGQGYVGLDEYGHLKINDYNLLALGMEAQQLGADLQIGSGLDIDAINTSLEEYVNDRICYPNATQNNNADNYNADNPTEVRKDPHAIELTLTLPEVTEAGDPIYIHDIGSRAGSYLYVHIKGSATSATVVLFENCEKLRVDDSIEGQPVLMFKNCNLYYNANVLDRTGDSGGGTGVENMTLWYERDYLNDGSPSTDSPDIQVDGMTVTYIGDIQETVNIDPWDLQNPNDNHYSYALRGLTFAGDSSIVGLSLLVACTSTANIDIADSIFQSTFTVPQSPSFGYPETKMVHKLKVTGSFVTCYWSTAHNKYILLESEFSALSQKYGISQSAITEPGSIAFYTKASLISHITGAGNDEVIHCWGNPSLHMFFGGAIE